MLGRNCYWHAVRDCFACNMEIFYDGKESGKPVSAGRILKTRVVGTISNI